MAHSQETREKVRKLYVEGMPLNGAALACGIGYDTARDWKARAEARGDNWDNARSAYRISEQGVDDLNQNLVEDFARQVLTTTRELEDSTIPAIDKATVIAQIADSYAKFSKAFGRTNPQYSGLSVALDTLRVITDYLRKNDPAALRALQPSLDSIGGILGKRYGK